MTTIENATPVGALRQRIADLETLRDRVDAELTAHRERLARISLATRPMDRARVPDGINSRDVRAWGRAQGWVVGDRGRLPAGLIDAYLARRRHP